ncbi:MAG: DUF5684 domain-containing protein [Cyclobacteriaceae bacterium]|nr:hypothetical protein [Cyclobacteriaceae bacterium]MCB0500889.1 hypothetical protein [Cyclobacteriaceae bacterium]MCO5270042.1 DUF5684 domain-containing protein [Cyclobacteriaceae bacterium]MCW5902538.1 hypothetical protein [Cyclobacteriaceae bacterium]
MENYDPYSGGIMAAMGAFAFVYFIILIVMIVGMWKVFEKAGKPGWAAIIPIYNIIVLLEVVGKPTWWIILMLIPFVNFIIAIILCHQLSLSFGQGVGMTILIIVLPFVALPILGFGSATYSKPATAA